MMVTLKDATVIKKPIDTINNIETTWYNDNSIIINPTNNAIAEVTINDVQLYFMSYVIIVYDIDDNMTYIYTVDDPELVEVYADVKSQFDISNTFGAFAGIPIIVIDKANFNRL